MKKMNKKGFTLVELLAVIVILAILMAIAATNLGPVIDNSRRASMRSTAQQILNSVQSQLTSSFELYPGTYEWDTGILDSGGISAPFGGEYRYHKPGSGRKIGSGVYAMETDINPTADNACTGSKVSFIVIKRDSNGKYKYAICLSTSPEGKPGEAGQAWLFGTREELDKKSNKVFCGTAAAGLSDDTCKGVTEW